MTAPRLAGKRAFVTGASSGIGRAIALALAAGGASVAASGRDEERLAETCASITEAGGRALPLRVDVADATAVESAIDLAANELGGIDTVVNCAGVSEVDGWFPVHRQTLEGWQRTFDVNVNGAFFVSRAALPHLLEAGAGALVHISTVAAWDVLAGNVAYGASKAALNQLSRHIAVEYAEFGIRSNAILPGEINTPASTRAFALAEAAGGFSRADLLQRYPAARFGTPEEIAMTVVFLCSDEAPFLTGAAIPVDGGFTSLGMPGPDWRGPGE